MTSRKRGRAEMESSEPAPELDLLQRVRNMWEFANLMQYIFIFGKASKIDEDLTIEDLENECIQLGPSPKLAEIGLALLKYISSHRGLTPELFDEYTRRQFVAKAPERNPFGTEETPTKFADLDVFTKIRVLWQMSQWTFLNAERMREKMSDTKDSEQTQWRIEEIGYDKQERYYFVLDDNRLYRRTDPPPPKPRAPKPKANSKKAKAAARASKRRKLKEAQDTEDEPEGDAIAGEEANGLTELDAFGGRKWECLAVTLQEYTEFLESIKKSKDADEKALYQRITEEVLPVIEKEEEAQQRKLARKERELTNIQKLATAKRSSRLASKFEKEKEEQEAVDAERKKKAELAAAIAHEEKQKRMEEARESRMMTREQRLKEREYKRVLLEQELANLSEDSKKVDSGEARMSERQLKAEMEKKKKESEALNQEEPWTFDCSKCGQHGENWDDGTHSVSCEQCNVWQHSACLGISEADAEKDDFHFVCHDCSRRAEDAAKPKIPPLKFYLGSSSSPLSQKSQHSANESKKRKSLEDGGQMPPLKKFKPAEIYSASSTPLNPERTHSGINGMQKILMNGPTLSPQGQVQYPTQQENQSIPPPGLRSPRGPPAYTNGYTNHVSPQNGTGHQTTPQQHLPSSSPPSSGATHPNGLLGPNRPAQFAVQPTPQRTPYPPTPSSQNPYHNSFDRQRPSSSHATNNIPSPSKSRQPSSVSPAITHDTTPRLLPPFPYTNGIHPNNESSVSNILPAALPTPLKQQTSPPAPPPTPLDPRSSPIVNQPTLERSEKSSPGFSPTKKSPPRLPADLSFSPTTPVLPPPATLMPRPKQTGLEELMNGTAGANGVEVNGDGHINDPATAAKQIGLGINGDGSYES